MATSDTSDDPKQTDADGAHEVTAATETGPEILEAEVIADIPADGDVPDNPPEQAEPEVEAAEEPAPQPVKAGPGFVPLVAGGAVAAVIGAAAALLISPSPWPFGEEPQVDLTPIEARLAQLDTQSKDQDGILQGLTVQIGETTTRFETFAANPPGAEAISDLQNRLAGIEARLTQLENRPVPQNVLPDEARAMIEQEVGDIRAMLDAELSRLEAAQADARALEAEANTAARAATIAAAKARLMAAIDAGAPFADELSALSDLGFASPADVAALADEGVPSLADLQDKFPAAARQALDVASRTETSTGTMDRLSSFLRRQLGVRSLEPQEGESTDAILSRAEAALRSGDVPTALSELDTLAPAPAAEMADWVGLARTRDAVQTALADFM